MKTLKQWCELVSLADFTMVSGRSRVVVKIGQVFVITNSQTEQAYKGLYCIGRKKNARAGIGYYISPELLASYFCTPEEKL